MESTNQNKNLEIKHINPNQPLITQPYVTIKLIKMQNAYKPCENSRYELYANLGLDLQQKFKTATIKNTPNPQFQEQYKTNLEEFKNSQFFNIGIYDKDNFGSDEFIANQILPTNYFIHQFNKKQKPIYLSFVLNPEFDYENEYIEDEELTWDHIQNTLDNKQYLRDIQYFPQQKLSKTSSNNQSTSQSSPTNSKSSSESKKNENDTKDNINQQQQQQQQQQQITVTSISTNKNKEIPEYIKNKYITGKFPQIMDIEVIVHDVKNLYKLQCDIVSTKKQDSGSNAVYFYEFFMKRNDGLAWRIQRRYKQIRKFRDDCIQQIPEIENIKFPSKDVILSLKGIISMSSPEEYEQQSEKRRVELQQFFDKVLKQDSVYSLQCFQDFFSYNNKSEQEED